MNQFSTILCLLVLCTACVNEEEPIQHKEINYICSSLAKNYLKMIRQDAYQLKNKAQNDPHSIQFVYVKSQNSGQMAFNPETKFLECKQEKYTYVLSERDQLTGKKHLTLTLTLPFKDISIKD
jgi:hypothetical protein